jgi:hypothetical protein
MTIMGVLIKQSSISLRISKSNIKDLLAKEKSRGITLFFYISVNRLEIKGKRGWIRVRAVG